MSWMNSAGPRTGAHVWGWQDGAESPGASHRSFPLGSSVCTCWPRAECGYLS